jgi:hypothetical protein
MLGTSTSSVTALLLLSLLKKLDRLNDRFDFCLIKQISDAIPCIADFVFDLSIHRLTD